MPAPGTVLGGKYQLVRELGAGGMGIVYEAEHLRLRQPFAIKILQPEFASEREFLIRFEREARAAALLRSPHIVRVFDVDVAPEGLTYMVMELLTGNDLAAEVDARRIELAELVDWIVQACSALQEAHDNGIVHRDLKPANIFLSKTEAGERIAKVLDFGISKIEAISTKLTNRATGSLGTPTYMAPEQIRNRRVDGRTDVWALGVILYRVLGARWPFTGSNEQGYMASVLANPPLPFEMVRPELPFELATVIMKCLEKSLDDRWPSADALAQALAPFGTGKMPLLSAQNLRVAALPSGAHRAQPVAQGAPTVATRPAAATELSAKATELSAKATELPAHAKATELAVPARPDAIVIPVEVSARPESPMAAMSDRTVSDTKQRGLGRGNTQPMSPGLLPAAPVTPPATSFATPETRASGPSGVAILIAACAAAGIGFGVYMGFTAPRDRVPAGAASTASAPRSPSSDPNIFPPEVVPSSSSEVAPPSTGVPTASAPLPSSSAVRKPPRPAPSSSAAPRTSASAPTQELPDHL